METTTPPQEELRRRFRAARALAGLTFSELAERIPPDIREMFMDRLEVERTRREVEFNRRLAALEEQLRELADDERTEPHNGPSTSGARHS
jgi:ribosome-binding protein aMBF1 (putative translation factor)